MKSDALLAAWQRALNSPYGALFETNDLVGARSRLYAARKGHSEFDELTLRPNPAAPNTQFFILRRAP